MADTTDDALAAGILEFESVFRLEAITGEHIVRFFRACECPVTWARVIDEQYQKIWALLIKPNSRPLVEGFGLQRELLVICSTHKDFQPRLLDAKKQVERLIRTPGRLQDDLIVVLSDAPDAAALLAKVEDVAQVFLHLSSDEIANSLSSGHPSEQFRARIQEQFYARDFFDRSGPVFGNEFFGRKRLLQDIASHMEKGSHLGLYGLRKVGKTSIIKTLLERRRELCPELFFCHIDLLAVPPANRSFHYLLFLIAEDLGRSIEKTDLTSVSVRTIGRTQRFDRITDMISFERSFDADLRAILHLMSAKRQRLVVILDEIERLFPLAESGGFEGYEKFLEYMRGLSQSVGPLSLLVVGVNPNISEAQYLGQRQNPMFGFFSTRYAAPLALDELREMLRSLGRSSGARFDGQAVDALYGLLGGHPYLTRRFCSLLIRDQIRPTLITAIMVASHREQFLRQETSAFAEMVSVVKEVYPQEFDALQTIAADPDGIALASVARQTLAHLEGYQLVEERQGRVQLRNELVRDWLTGISRNVAGTAKKRREPPRDVDEAASGVVTQDQLAEILRTLELRMRAVVRRAMDIRWASKADSRIRAAIGSEAIALAEKRIATSLRKAPEAGEAAAEILDYVYIGDLAHVILGNEWSEFRLQFKDKKETERNISIVSAARNEIQHYRQLPVNHLLRTYVAATDLLELMNDGD